MTKKQKNLTWNLPELPTGGELADLVDSGVLSKDEAREIALGSAESDKEVIKTLQEQIEFLQDLVKDLSKRNTITYIPSITREIHTSRPYFEKYWMGTVNTLGNAGYKLDTGTVTTTAGTMGSTFHTAQSISEPQVMNVSLSRKDAIS